MRPQAKCQHITLSGRDSGTLSSMHRCVVASDSKWLTPHVLCTHVQIVSRNVYFKEIMLPYGKCLCRVQHDSILKIKTSALGESSLD
jgi:hypothetical protein